MEHMPVMPKRWCLCLLLLTLAGMPAACQKPAPSKPAAAKSAFDKATLEAYVRHLYAWGGEVKVEIGAPKPSPVAGLSEVIVKASAEGASVEQPFLVSKDGKSIIQGTVYDITDNPFRADLDKLTSLNGPSLGTPGAPVVLVLFTDYQCPYCRVEAQMLRKNLLATYPKEVRLYLQEFPLEQIHPWAKAAAMAGRCFLQQGEASYWDYHDWVFAQAPQITPENLKEKVIAFAQSKGVDALQMNRCLDSNVMEGEIAMSVALARSLNLNATPTLFINGRRIAAQLSWDQMREIIDSEIVYQKTANNAGDKDCCSVSLPSPLRPK